MGGQIDSKDRAKHVASVIHITDLHLFVTEDGKTREPTERRRMDHFLNQIGAHGLDFAERPRVLGFLRALRNATKAERQLVGSEDWVIAVQTGDVEAYGSFPTAEAFPGFSYLESKVLVDLDLRFVGLYGNHDVWPGGFPLFSPQVRSHDEQKRNLALTTSITGPLPPTVPVRCDTNSPLQLAFVPVNSVSSRVFGGGVRADGEISPHPPSAVNVRDALRAIQFEPNDLRIVLQHHPVHDFGPIAGGPVPHFGRLRQPEVLADIYSEIGIHLVVGGHRHSLNPPHRSHIEASPLSQPPLAPPTAQVASLSPTIRSHAAGDARLRSGLCVYRLIHDVVNNQFSIDRAIYSTLAGSQLPVVEPSLIRKIPLD